MARVLASAASLYRPVRMKMCEGMCTRWPEPGTNPTSRSAEGSPRSGHGEASMAWM